MWKTALPKTDIYSHWKEAFKNGKSCSQSPFFRESTPLVVGTPFGELVFVVWQHHPAGPKENASNLIKPFFGDVDVRGIWRRFARATTKPPNHQDSTKFPLTQSVNQPSRPNHQLSPFALSHHHIVIAVKSIRSVFFLWYFFCCWGWLCSPSLVEQAPLYNLRGRALLAQLPPVAWAAIGFGWFR